MDPVVLREYQIKLGEWLGRGYQVLADDVDGELRVTAHYVSSVNGEGSEREQDFWPMTPEIVELLSTNGVVISHALAGPRPWAGPHPGAR